MGQPPSGPFPQWGGGYPLPRSTTLGACSTSTPPFQKSWVRHWKKCDNEVKKQSEVFSLNKDTEMFQLQTTMRHIEWQEIKLRLQ